ncbi:MAG: adenosylcobinamide-GDP ribazoletransferase [Thaumarchaeota archaeon]|nr:adenosylcobinamide-GDP ribazoletransferase [Nitrososphaerota archaeon]
MFKGLRAVIAFLTVFPVKEEQENLNFAAKSMPLFPVVGFGIGMIVGIAALIFLDFFPSLVAGPLTVAVLLWITGLHHTDGLLDFGDGLMCKGSKERKLEAMRDKMTGVGGFSAGLIVLLTTALVISSFSARNILFSLASAEVTAKMSMVLAASIGRSASPGLNVPFIDAMHGRNRVALTVLSVLFALLISLLATGFFGFLSVMAAIVATVFLERISRRHFGGLTGDVFGAINEVSRLASLLVLARG